MKLITHERSGKPESMTLQADPMIVWISREHELKIEKGDTLTDVANVVTRHWGLSQKEARVLVAYWFAIGERIVKRKLGSAWTEAELSTKFGRRYLATSSK